MRLGKSDSVHNVAPPRRSNPGARCNGLPLEKAHENIASSRESLIASYIAGMSWPANLLLEENAGRPQCTELYLIQHTSTRFKPQPRSRSSNPLQSSSRF